MSPGAPSSRSRRGGRSARRRAALLAACLLVATLAFHLWPSLLPADTLGEAARDGSVATDGSLPPSDNGTAPPGGDADNALPADKGAAPSSSCEAGGSAPPSPAGSGPGGEGEPAPVAPESPSSAPAPPPETAAARSSVVRIAAVGDVMMGNLDPEPWLPPDDGRRLFDAAAFAFRGRDLVLANLEGTLYEGDGPSKCDLRRQEREREERRTGRKEPEPEKRLCYAFRSPVRYAAHLARAGIGAVNVANNHARDFLDAGVESTLSALDNAGVAAVGGERVGRFTTPAGTRIAVLGFSYSAPSRTTLSLFDLDGAAATIAKARKEADLVVVSFHGGAEGKDALRIPGGMESFAGEKRGDVTAFAHAAVDAGAHLVVGHGPHVPRAMELYRGKLVAYSLGNFLAYGWFNLKGESGTGYVLQADLDGRTGDFRKGKIVSVRLVRGGIPVPDPDRDAVRIVRRLTREDRGGGGLAIRDDGTIMPAPPTRPLP